MRTFASAVLRHKMTLISVRRTVRAMVAELPPTVRSYPRPSPCGLYYAGTAAERPVTSDGMKPFVEVEILSPGAPASAAAFSGAYTDAAIDSHVAWSEKLHEREIALQRELSKQAARDDAAWSLSA